MIEKKAERKQTIAKQSVILFQFSNSWHLKVIYKFVSQIF